jgi:hypothetical protein
VLNYRVIFVGVLYVTISVITGERAAAAASEDMHLLAAVPAFIGALIVAAGLGWKRSHRSH